MLEHKETMLSTKDSMLSTKDSMLSTKDSIIATQDERIATHEKEIAFQDARHEKEVHILQAQLDYFREHITALHIMDKYEYMRIERLSNKASRAELWAGHLKKNPGLAKKLDAIETLDWAAKTDEIYRLLLDDIGSHPIRTGYYEFVLKVSRNAPLYVVGFIRALANEFYGDTVVVIVADVPKEEEDD